MDTLVQQGVSFNNCWMMPECSPSRACFFTGRYLLRTGVRAAILDYDLPSSQVSPYEVTTPRVLAHAGHASALMGTFHLSGPDNNPPGQLEASPQLSASTLGNPSAASRSPLVTPTTSS